MRDTTPRQFLINAFAGATAGAMTGSIVAIPEYIKVLQQAAALNNTKTPWNRAGLIKHGAAAVKTIPMFSSMFACVCALEFSTNAAIAEKYGKPAGLLASGVTGAFFLTIADHAMYIQHNTGSMRQAWHYAKRHPGNMMAGFEPMCARESLFIANVTLLGPYVGDQLQKMLRGPKQESDWRFDFLGRLMFGGITTLISQPFDTLARIAQHEAKETGKRPSITALLKNPKNRNVAMLYKGWFPRLVLAASGGALIGAAYDQAKPVIEEMADTMFPIKP